MFSREIEELYSSQIALSKLSSAELPHMESILTLLLKADSLLPIWRDCGVETAVLESLLVRNSASFPSMSTTEAFQRATLRARATNTPVNLKASDLLLVVFEKGATAEIETLKDAGITREGFMEFFLSDDQSSFC